MSSLTPRINSVFHRLAGMLPPRAGLALRTRYDVMRRIVDPEIVHTPPVMTHRRVAVDVGANYGVTTMVLARHFQRVEGIEANPDLAARLTAALPKHAHIHSCAISDKPGQADLRIPVQNGVTLAGWASLDKPHVGDETTWRRVSVETRTLDSMQFDDVDLIKIDVEGHELAVLHGARETISRNRPWLIVEVWDEHRDSVTSLLTGQGYKCRTLEQLCGVQGSHQNLIFLPD